MTSAPAPDVPPVWCYSIKYPNHPLPRIFGIVHYNRPDFPRSLDHADPYLKMAVEMVTANKNKKPPSHASDHATYEGLLGYMKPETECALFLRKEGPNWIPMALAQYCDTNFAPQEANMPLHNVNDGQTSLYLIRLDYSYSAQGTGGYFIRCCVLAGLAAFTQPSAIFRAGRGDASNIQAPFNFFNWGKAPGYFSSCLDGIELRNLLSTVLPPVRQIIQGTVQIKYMVYDDPRHSIKHIPFTQRTHPVKVTDAFLNGLEQDLRNGFLILLIGSESGFDRLLVYHPSALSLLPKLLGQEHDRDKHRAMTSFLESLEKAGNDAVVLESWMDLTCPLTDATWSQANVRAHQGLLLALQHNRKQTACAIRSPRNASVLAALQCRHPAKAKDAVLVAFDESTIKGDLDRHRDTPLVVSGSHLPK